MGVIDAPRPLRSENRLEEFCSGEPSLDEWLIKRALKNQNTGASRTFVVSDSKRVVGFYSLATGSVERLLVPGAVARNMPDPIPVIVLARLAVDRSYQGQGLGAALLRDALFRTLSVAEQVGVRCLLVHALSEDACQFYLKHGFQASQLDPMTLMCPMSHIARHLGDSR